jgi:hypothetical protein
VTSNRIQKTVKTAGGALYCESIRDTERYRKKKYDATLMQLSDMIRGVYTQDKTQGAQAVSESSFCRYICLIQYDWMKEIPGKDRYVTEDALIKVVEILMI